MLVIALVNQTLVTIGWSPIPYAEEEIEQSVTATLTVLATIWTYWKNNSVTKEAKEADKQLARMKHNKKKNK